MDPLDRLRAAGKRMTDPAESLAQRVAERVGFSREAVLRSYMRSRDGRQDMVAFGLLRAEVGS